MSFTCNVLEIGWIIEFHKLQIYHLLTTAIVTFFILNAILTNNLNPIHLVFILSSDTFQIETILKLTISAKQVFVVIFSMDVR